MISRARGPWEKLTVERTLVLDAKAYRKRVTAMIGQNRQLQSDIGSATRELQRTSDPSELRRIVQGLPLPELYDIDAADGDLAGHLKRLRLEGLNKGQLPALVLLRQFDEQLAKSFGAALDTPAFWEEMRAAAAVAGRAALEGFAQDLSKSLHLGVISPDELRKKARAQGISAAVTDVDLHACVTAAGVEVASDFAAPACSADLPALQRDLHSSLRSPVDALLQHLAPSLASDIHVIDDFDAVAGGGRCRLGLADVDASYARCNTRSGDDIESAKKALGLLRTMCHSDDELRAMVLSWYLGLADSLVRKQGLLPLAAVRRLVDTGLSDRDARRIVTKAGSAVTGPTLQDVIDRLGAGDLQGAQRAMAALEMADGGETPTEPRQRVIDALEKASRAKADALAAYDEAVASQDHGAARAALRRAQEVDGFDATLSERAEQLPPAVPTRLSAVTDPTTGAVRATWRGENDGTVRYVVVRSTGAAPLTPHAGTPLGGPTAACEAIDTTAPAGVRTVYAVFAQRGTGDFSQPASTSVVLLPPPARVEVTPSSTTVSVFWSVNQSSTGVHVELVRPDGSVRDLGTTTRDRVQIEGLELGVRYTVRLTAYYLVDGTVASSDSVTASVTPRGAVRAVSDLGVESHPLPDGRPGVRARWTAVPGYTVDLWALPLGSALPRGRTTEADLEGCGGARVTGVAGQDGAAEWLTFPPRTALCALVPVTVDGSEVLPGTPVTTGQIPVPKRVEAERFGSELRVTWQWPHGDYEAEVTWPGGGPLRVDRHRYRESGGVRIPDARSVGEVTVSMVAIGGGQSAGGPSVTVACDAVQGTVSYELKLPRGIFGGGTAHVTVMAEGFSGTARLVAVLAQRTFMPTSPSEGTTLATLTLDFGDGAVRTASFPVPKVKKPYWVRLFPADASSFALQDPPAAAMKG